MKNLSNAYLSIILKVDKDCLQLWVSTYILA